MFTFLIILHVIVCAILITLILLQPSEGRGLSDTFGGGVAESILGSKASAFLTKTTAVLAVLFFVVCLSVAVLSIKKSKSLLEGKTVTTEESTSSQKTQEKEDVKEESSNTEPSQSQSTQKQ